MNAPQRKRIVIDLQRSPQAITTGKRRRWSRVLALLASVLVGLIVVAGLSGYLWWGHYKTTPAYSLALIVDAAQRNDLETFNRLVSSEKIVESLTSQAADKVTSRLGLPGSILNTQLGNVRPSLPPELKPTFNAWLADEIKEFSFKFKTRSFVIIALSLRAMVKITGDDTTARIDATLRDQPVELTMKREGEIWQLVDLKNEGLLTRVVEEVGRAVPATSPLKAVEPGTRVRKQRR
jgi:hypothetical protein